MLTFRKALRLGLFIGGIGGANVVCATGFGIFDSRSLAMGGSSVAVGDTASAHFYNPALLAFHDGREEDTLDGREIYPNIVLQASESIEDTADLVDKELDTEITNRVNAYNANRNVSNANAFILTARDLQSEMENYQEIDDLFAEISTSVTISEPSDREGGSFYILTRAIGLGNPTITDADLSLLDDYIETMEFVASGGAAGQLHPELFNEEGELSDPRNSLTSTADLSGLLIAEFGVSAAKEFPIWGIPIAFGVTPKVLAIRTYRDILDFEETSIDYAENEERYLNLNADLGIAYQHGDHLRVGLSIKDAIPEDFKAKTGEVITLRPKTRIGVAYVNDKVSIGFDLDVEKNHPLASELENQDASLGLEWRIARSVSVRTGYRQDLNGNYQDIQSAGILVRSKRFISELSYAQGDNYVGASFQFGFAF